MRIFLAGASGVIGARLIPLLVREGHSVVGMTRSPQKLERLQELGAEPVVCDVYDAAALRAAVTEASPELVMHQLTDLPERLSRLGLYMLRNNRIRNEGTRNLLEAGQAAGAKRFIAQSIAFKAPGATRAVKNHEGMVLDAGGVVLRYGMFYGPGTYSEDGKLLLRPKVHVDEAARRTVELLDAPSGVMVVSDEGVQAA